MDSGSAGKLACGGREWGMTARAGSKNVGTRSSGDQFVEASALSHEIEFALGIFSEAGDVGLSE